MAKLTKDDAKMLREEIGNVPDVQLLEKYRLSRAQLAYHKRNKIALEEQMAAENQIHPDKEEAEKSPPIEVETSKSEPVTDAVAETVDDTVAPKPPLVIGYCSECNAEVHDGDVRCKNCGEVFT